MSDSLAESLGEVPAKDVTTFAKAASDEAARWIKRIRVDAGAGTLTLAGTPPSRQLLQRPEHADPGIFILIATGGRIYTDPLSSKIIASDSDALVKLFLQSDAPDLRATVSEYVELLVADKVKANKTQFGGPATTITKTML